MKYKAKQVCGAWRLSAERPLLFAILHAPAYCTTVLRQASAHDHKQKHAACGGRTIALAVIRPSAVMVIAKDELSTQCALVMFSLKLIDCLLRPMFATFYAVWGGKIVDRAKLSATCMCCFSNTNI